MSKVTDSSASLKTGYTHPWIQDALVCPPERRALPGCSADTMVKRTSSRVTRRRHINVLRDSKTLLDMNTFSPLEPLGG